MYESFRRKNAYQEAGELGVPEGHVLLAGRQGAHLRQSRIVSYSGTMEPKSSSLWKTALEKLCDPLLPRIGRQAPQRKPFCLASKRMRSLPRER